MAIAHIPPQHQHLPIPPKRPDPRGWQPSSRAVPPPEHALPSRPLRAQATGQRHPGGHPEARCYPVLSPGGGGVCLAARP